MLSSSGALNIESLNVDSQTKNILQTLQNQSEAKTQEIKDLKSVCKHKDSIIADFEKKTQKEGSVANVKIIHLFVSILF